MPALLLHKRQVDAMCALGNGSHMQQTPQICSMLAKRVHNVLPHILCHYGSAAQATSPNCARVDQMSAL